LFPWNYNFIRISSIEILTCIFTQTDTSALKSLGIIIALRVV